jgi:hypothetical protein
MQIIWPYINSDVWGRRLRDYPADAAWAEAQLTTWGW